jgi:hypothetical protein
LYAKGINPPKRVDTLISAQLGLCIICIGLSQVVTRTICDELSRLGKGGIFMSIKAQLKKIP